MATVNKLNPDFMLRNSLRCTEEPSPGLNYRLLQQVRNTSRDKAESGGRPLRLRLAAVTAAAVLLVALSTVALAATGVLGDWYASMRVGNQIRTNTRQALIENDYVTEIEADAAAAVSETDGKRLELNAYYADSREIGLDFTLTGADVPEGYNNLRISGFVLEMTDAGGNVRTWHPLSDSENVHIFDARTIKTGEGTHNISVFITFKDSVDIGVSARVTMSGISFVRYGDISDDNAVDEYYPLDGTWSFEFDIDGSFANVEAISYAPTIDGAISGIEITSITVLPTVCRIEAVIDFSETGLTDPNNESIARAAAAEGYITFEEAFAKHNFLDLNMFAMTDEYMAYLAEYQAMSEEEQHARRLENKEASERGQNQDVSRGYYSGAASGYNPETDIQGGGNGVRCWFEIESMYFDAPDNIILRFMGYDMDVTVDIPVAIT